MAANDSNLYYRPCLVVANTDPRCALETRRSFRRLGWDVYLAQTGPEARRLSRMLEADLVVLDVDLHDESGFLTCAKLLHERPRIAVVLVGADPTEQGRQLAGFVGARVLLAMSADLAALLCELRGLPLSAAG
jgi:DNA-binding response OmpR family regulator